MPLADPTTIGAVELPVTLYVGDPATAGPVPIGSVHLALRVDGLDDPTLPEGGYRLVPVDPGDLRTQLADLLDAHAAALRLPEPEGSTGAAPPH